MSPSVKDIKNKKDKIEIDIKYKISKIKTVKYDNFKVSLKDLITSYKKENKPPRKSEYTNPKSWNILFISHI